MKRYNTTIILILLLSMIFSININAKENKGGVEYTHKDELAAIKIYNNIKRGKKVTLYEYKNKRSEAITAAFCEHYFDMINENDIINFYGCEYKGKDYDEFEFPSKKKLKKLEKKQKKLEQKIKKENKALRKWEQEIANECMKYPTQKEQFEALERYMVANFEYDYSRVECEEGDYIAEKYDQYSQSEGNSYIVYVTHKGICCDFSQLVDDICEIMNIECKIISGGSEKGLVTHAWNLVVLDNIVYQVDVTWDICLEEIIYGPDCDRNFFAATHYLDEIEN